MRRHIHTARDLLLPVIDFFYPPFKRLMNLQTFRYAVCGASNTVLGFIVFYICFKFIFAGENIDLGFYVFTPYTVALVASFCISFPFGFFLLKYVVFSDSGLRGRVQLFRYFVVYLINLFLNYVLLKITVEMLHIYPTIAQLIDIVILVILSYLFQRHFTFRKKAAEEDLSN
ncbi:MAG TPA: GtrA family protein [Chitinophagaceae bacterium]|nr:GtrA family protein [Chitinophagaceae bacterium]